MTLNIGGRVHDPTDPVRRLLFNVLAMIAEFESGLIRMRTREGMKVAKAKGRLRGKRPKRKPPQEAHLVELWHAENTPAPTKIILSADRCSIVPTPLFLYPGLQRDRRRGECGEEEGVVLVAA
jgi:DNA invertase Pin-like site-specific DNA recombinase